MSYHHYTYKDRKKSFNSVFFYRHHFDLNNVKNGSMILSGFILMKMKICFNVD